jgi:hypothetical protein
MKRLAVGAASAGRVQDIMRTVLTLLLLPIVFPVYMVVWSFRAVFGSKVVALGYTQRAEMLEDAEWLRSFAPVVPDANVRAKLEGAAQSLQQVSSHEAAKRGAFEDYRRNVRMLREMNLTGRTGAAKFVVAVTLLWDAATRLAVKQGGAKPS